MKKELRKKIKSICDEIGTAAAAEQLDELTEKVDAEYERRVAEGMSELDAYREVLSNVDKVREMLNELPKTDEERERERVEENGKRVKVVLDTIEACMWILTVIVYFLISFKFGHWYLTWLIFLSSAIGSVILNMLRKYNNGMPLGRVFEKNFSGILWLAIVIVYFLYSFTFGGWAYTWLIFLIGAAIEVIINGIRKVTRGK